MRSSKIFVLLDLAQTRLNAFSQNLREVGLYFLGGREDRDRREERERGMERGTVPYREGQRERGGRVRARKDR